MRRLILIVAIVWACDDDNALPPEVSNTSLLSASADIDSLVTLGEAQYQEGAYDSAQAIWQRGLKGTRSRNDSANEARFLMWLGIVAWKTGDFEAARTYSEQGLARKLEHGMKAELSRSYNTLGNVALADYRLIDAQVAFKRAEETALAVNDTESVGRAAGGLGLVATYLGDLDAGRAHLQKQREIGRAIGNDRFQANALANLAMTNIWAGDPQPAIEQLDSARVIYRRLKQPDGEPNALGQLATAYSLRGDYSRAFAALDTALVVARKLGLRAEEEENLRLAAGLHAQLGDLRRAVALYTDAEALASDLGFSAQHAMNLRRRAEVHASLDNLPAALRDAEAALHVDQGAGARYDEFEDQIALAKIHERAGHTLASDRAVAQAQHIVPALQARGAVTVLALARAHIADQRNQPARVLKILLDARRDQPTGEYDAAWQIDALQAKSYAKLNQVDSAIAAGRRAVAHIQRTRDALASETLRTNYTAERADVFAQLVLALLRVGRTEEAFDVADAAHSSALLGRLNTTRQTAQHGESDEAAVLLVRIDALLREIGKIERTPPRERGSGMVATLAEVQNRLAQLRTEYEAYHIRRAQLGAGRVKAPANDAAKRVRNVLGAGEAVVEYFIADNELILFVITRERVNMLRTPVDAAAMASQIRVLRELWATPDPRWTDGLAAAQGLHGRLLGSARAARMLEGAGKLFVVPHGLLAEVPFAALHDASSNRFAIQDYEISYLPSGVALSDLREAGKSKGISLKRGFAFAPSVGTLPATADEVRAVRQRMRGIKVYLGEAANETAVRAALDQPRIVHIAGHGVLNARNPMFSRVELARGGDASGDGRLEFHEVVDLQVRSPLVFLSGCETAAAREWLPELVQGAGEMTLTDAFMHAGASAVVATLWRIDDVAAARVAEAFYAGLRSESASGALRHAQRSLMADARYRNPYYWAAHTLTGEAHSRGRR